MNPYTRQLELLPAQDVKPYYSRPAPAVLVDAVNRLEAHRVPESEKENWTTFQIGEAVVVEVATGAQLNMTVANLHAPGILLKGGSISKVLGPLEPGQPLTVKGESCKVVKVSSKGLYVKGA